MLIARYEDQVQQLKISMSRSTSIALLKQVGEKIQVLNKQIARVNALILAPRIALQALASPVFGQSATQTLSIRASTAVRASLRSGYLTINSSGWRPVRPMMSATSMMSL